MDKYPVIALRGVLTVVAGVLCLPGNLWGSEITLVPKIEVKEIYTDNVRLTGRTGKSDLVTDLAAGVTLNARGRHSTVALNYRFDYLYFADLGKDDIRNDLIGTANFELIDSLLFLNAQASVSEQFVTRGGSFSANIGNLSDNRRTIQVYNISPTVRHHVGTYADIEGTYRFGYFKSENRPEDAANNFTLSETVTNTVRATITSGNWFDALSWQLLFQHDNSDRTNRATSFKQTLARGDVELKLTHWLALLGSGGYERFRDATIGFDPSGATWDFGGRWTPGPRTSISVRYGRRFNDMVWSAEGVYRMSANTSVRLSYLEDIDTSQRGLGRRLGGAVIDNLGRIIDPTTGLVFDPSDPSFNLSDAAFQVKRFRMNLVGSRGKNTFSLSSFYELRQRPTVIPSQALADEESRGISFAINREVNRKTNANVNFNFRRNLFGFQNRKDNFFGGGASISYKLGQQVAGELRYNLAHRTSSRPANDFVENSVSISLAATF